MKKGVRQLRIMTRYIEILTLLLAVVCTGSGCKKHRDIPTEKGAEPKNPEAMVHTVNRESQRLPPLEKEGKERRFDSNILTFNLLGDMTYTPLEVGEWVEYQLSDGHQALVVYDNRTKTSLIIEYDIAGSSDVVSIAGFVMMQHDYEGEPEAEMARRWQKYLADPTISKGIYDLKGQVRVTLQDGQVTEVTLKDVETIQMMPLNQAKAESNLAFSEHQLAAAKEQLRKDPNSEIYKWAVQHETEIINSIRSRMTSGQRCLGGYSDGHIIPVWQDKRTGWDIPLL